MFFAIIAPTLLLMGGSVPNTHVDEEIVVIAKLQRHGVHLQNAPDGKGLQCAVTRSTGDLPFDRAACLATVRCYGKKTIGAVSQKKHDQVSRCVRKKMLSWEKRRRNAG